MADQYKYHEVWTSSGKSTLKIKKGRTGSPEFWAAVDAAEAEGRRYCGYGNHPADEADMHGKYQCRNCYRSRMIGFGNYRPPRQRQSIDAIRGFERGGGHGVPTAVDHRAYWDQYKREDEAREAALRQLAALQTPLEPPSVHVDAFTPPGDTSTPEGASTPVGEPRGSEWITTDVETQARLDRLRQQLSGEK